VSNKKRSYTPRSKKKEMVVNEVHENGDTQSDIKVSFISNGPTEISDNMNGSFDTSSMELLRRIDENPI
jgi:hypothetical protein